MSAKLVQHPKAVERTRKDETESKITKQIRKLEREWEKLAAVVYESGGDPTRVRWHCEWEVQSLRKIFMQEGLLPLRREWL